MSTTELARRAHTAAEMLALQAKMFGPDDMAESIKSWRPRPTDIVISPFGKCGTTWLQQTFHTLRTRGDMDFDDVSRVVPWIETAKGLGLDINAPQKAEPRGFKSHLSYDMLPKGARAVVSYRDPKDAMVSMYHFMEGWFFEPGAISIADFARMRLSNPNPRFAYWHHLVTWWEQRDNPDVLHFTYEEMSAEPERTVRRLAKFCGIPLDDALLKLTLERSSLAYMLAHKDRFDDRMMRELSERQCGLPKGSDSAKVRAGKIGSRRELPEEIGAMLDAKWAETVEPRFGFRNYAAFEAAVRAHGRAAEK